MAFSQLLYKSTEASKGVNKGCQMARTYITKIGFHSGFLDNSQSCHIFILQQGSLDDRRAFGGVFIQS